MQHQPRSVLASNADRYASSEQLLRAQVYSNSAPYFLMESHDGEAHDGFSDATVERAGVKGLWLSNLSRLATATPTRFRGTNLSMLSSAS